MQLAEQCFLLWSPNQNFSSPTPFAPGSCQSNAISPSICYRDPEFNRLLATQTELGLQTEAELDMAVMYLL